MGLLDRSVTVHDPAGINSVISIASNMSCRGTTEQGSSNISSGSSHLTVMRCDVTVMADAMLAMAGMPGLPPITGVINSGGVLKDNVFAAQTASSFRAVLAPKLASVAVSNIVEQPVHQIQLFSSTASLFGNPGQSNYAAANAALEGWALFYKACGINSIAIQWGAWEIGEHPSV